MTYALILDPAPLRVVRLLVISSYTASYTTSVWMMDYRLRCRIRFRIRPREPTSECPSGLPYKRRTIQLCWICLQGLGTAETLVLQTVYYNACCLIHSSAIGCSKLLIVQANKKVTIQQSCVVLYNYNHAESRKAVLECFDVLNSSFGYASVHRVLQSSSVTEMIRLLHGMIIISLQ